MMQIELFCQGLPFVVVRVAICHPTTGEKPASGVNIKPFVAYFAQGNNIVLFLYSTI
jgi:hypothetical protein